MRQALDKLPPKIKQTVILYYIEQFSVKEIKQILKIPEGTVKSRLSKEGNCSGLNFPEL